MRAETDRRREPLRRGIYFAGIFYFCWIVCFFISCNKKTDLKTFTDGIITVEAFTAIRPDVQISDKNICILKAKKDGQAEVIVSFNSYAVNNINVEIRDKRIVITPLDDLSAEEINSSAEKAEEVLGYRVEFDKVKR